ncbi:fibrous sheath-interacting protein 2-like [Pomacea canaliculata]|uniref:fibrous sheath-interacting protein 2-like n=1 Tax=Pomacea canaliculata TaxID=400727 RepID=UPI000D726F44|nr:fibrous sheath-interacting protein 2-like [Pomacea canaliculata]
MKRGKESMSSSIENLSMPRRQRVFDTNLVPAGDPLPVWSKLPLDAKLPVVPSPRGSYTLYTTHVGESKYINKQRYDFDLNDPFGHARPGEYDSLHDPYLKDYFFENPRTWRHLVHNKLITRDGKVKCDIKEFNQYREYLRYRSATDLALQKSGQRTDDGWMAGQRPVKTEHPRSRVGGSQDSVLTKDTDSSDRLAMYARDVSLVQRLRMRENLLLRRLEEKERYREADHKRRVIESWENRKLRQRRVLQREDEIDGQVREERLRQILQREKTMQQQRESLLAKISNRGGRMKTKRPEQEGKTKSEKEPKGEEDSSMEKSASTENPDESANEEVPVAAEE